MTNGPLNIGDLLMTALASAGGTTPEPCSAAELEQAVAAVVETFERDEAQGYRSRDRQFAISILRMALDRYRAGKQKEPT